MGIWPHQVDAVAPIVHDWSYKCLCHDLLPLRDGYLYTYRYENNSGAEESRDVALDEEDKVFRELQTLHLADVMHRVSEMTDEFRKKNKLAKSRVAKAQEGGGDSSMSDVKAQVAAMDSYRKTLSVLSLHQSVADDLASAVKARQLNSLGQLEQDLLFGDANSKDIKRALEAAAKGGGSSRGARLAAQAEAADRLRMLMAYFGTHAEKLDGAAGLSDWLSRASLPEGDGQAHPTLPLSCSGLCRCMLRSASQKARLSLRLCPQAILNLELLGCPVLKRPSKSKVKAVRRPKPVVAEDYDLHKYVPRLQARPTRLGAARTRAVQGSRPMG